MWSHTGRHEQGSDEILICDRDGGNTGSGKEALDVGRGDGRTLNFRAEGHGQGTGFVSRKEGFFFLPFSMIDMDQKSPIGSTSV
jgi:hypothetical protein